MFKNTASQKLTVFAFADAGHATLDAGDRVTGDAANITLKIEQDDDGTQSASNDVNPTEVEDGQYRFDLTQAETNGDKLTFYPESSTAGVQVIALPSCVIYTRPPGFSDFASLASFFTSSAQLVDDIWDEVITGAQHNVQNSSARFLREGSESNALLRGTAQSGTASTIVLESGAVTADDILNGERVAIIEGTGVGQSRLISDSVASSDTVTVSHNWTTAPDNTSVYAVMGAEADIRAVAEQAVSATATVDFDDLAAILADTNELQTDWTNDGRLDLLLDRLITELDTARAEPGQGAPAASAKIGAKIDYLYKAWRNKSTSTSSTYSLYADDTTTVDQKATQSDDGTTFTREEVGSGP